VGRLLPAACKVRHTFGKKQTGRRKEDVQKVKAQLLGTCLPVGKKDLRMPMAETEGDHARSYRAEKGAGKIAMIT